MEDTGLYECHVSVYDGGSPDLLLLGSDSTALTIIGKNPHTCTGTFKLTSADFVHGNQQHVAC